MHFVSYLKVGLERRAELLNFPPALDFLQGSVAAGLLFGRDISRYCRTSAAAGIMRLAALVVAIMAARVA